MDIVRKPRSRTHKSVVAAVFAAALLSIAALAMFRSTAPMATVERNSVWTERVRRGDLIRQVPVQGTLVPERIEWLSAASAGRVARIAVRPGESVGPETVVLVLENPDLELAALEAERQAVSAEAGLIQLDVRTQAEQKSQEASLIGLRSELRDAEIHAGAADRLAPQGLMTLLDHSEALNKARGLTERVAAEESRKRLLESGRSRQLVAQRAEVDRLKEIAKFRREQLAALEVRSNIHGIVQDIPLETGQWVAIGSLLAKIAEPDHLKAEVRVAEGNAKDVHRGQSVRFESTAGDFRGRVERVDPTVVGGNVKIEVALDDLMPKDARADQTVSGYVEIETLSNVLFVSRPAGARDETDARVFRLDGDRNQASSVTARWGRGSPREVEVAGGLAEGDEIVISDTSSWEVRDRIRLK